MPITPWVPAITKIKNGEDVSEEVLNPILAQHTQREQHLYEKFASIADKSVLIAYDQPVLPQQPHVVAKNRLVFYTQETIDNSLKEGISLAKVDFVVRNTQTSFAAANSAYSVGLVKSVNEDTTVADIYLMGLVNLDVDIDDPTFGFIQSNEINQEADFEPGPFFLSRTEAGKVTRNPGGVAIYIGYAFNRRNFLLAPNVSEFNQFFTTFRYNILDRPAGKPVLTGDTWTITDVNLDKVGWVPIDALPDSYSDLAPEGAKFFYNLPDESLIESDTGISEADQDEQKDLAKNLPPNPPNLTLLVVNGVIQERRDLIDPNGIYLVNDLGIWWFDDQLDQQPWASDIDAKKDVTFNASTDEIALADHNFILDDEVKFITTGTLPTTTTVTMDDETSYYVVALNKDGDHFKISTTRGGTALNFTGTGSGTHSIPQPYIWKNFRGTDAYRPKTYLQFIRLNPSIREAVVTSIKKYNAGSDIIKFYKNDKSAEAATGDLLARVQLLFEAGTEATSSAKALKSLTYNETTGKLTYVETPVVSKLLEGNGITIAPQVIAGVTQPGSYIVSSSTNNAQGRVSSIEPDGAELIFNGLHSYINMTVPSVLPSSIIGKILLPSGLPQADMTFVLLLIGAETSNTTKSVEFEFSYAVSKVGGVLDTTVSTPVSVLFDMPNPYTAKTVFKVGNASGAISAATLKIPASAFSGGDASVNFKLYRKQAALTPYTAPIGIVDVYWKIG